MLIITHKHQSSLKIFQDMYVKSLEDLIDEILRSGSVYAIQKDLCGPRQCSGPQQLLSTLPACTHTFTTALPPLCHSVFHKLRLLILNALFTCILKTYLWVSYCVTNYLKFS